MNKIYFTFIFDKSFILYNIKDIEKENIIKKIIGNFDKASNKSIVIKKKNLFISWINFNIKDKLSYFICITDNIEEKNLIFEIVSQSYNKFSLLYNKKYFDLNNEFIKDINNIIINKTYKELLNKHNSNKKLIKNIKKDWDETKDMTQNNILKFQERSNGLTEIENNLKNLNDTAIKFKQKSNDLKRLNFFKKWKYIFITGILLVIILLILFFYFKQLNINNN